MNIEGKDTKANGKRLWSILRAMYYMLKDGMATQRLIMDLKLNLLTLSEHIDGLSRRYVDPAKSYYDQRQVEFSCSNTPLYVPKRKNKRYRYYDREAAIAKAFEILNKNSEAMCSQDESRMVTPSPMWRFRIDSPAVVRKVRATDSPFLVKEELGGSVDREAEEFIRRFYEQLRLQHKSLLARD